MTTSRILKIPMAAMVVNFIAMLVGIGAVQGNGGLLSGRQAQASTATFPL